MDKIQIFTNNIVISSFNNSQVKEEIIKELDYAEKNNLNTRLSNVGGFQTGMINNKIITQNLCEESYKILKQNYKFKTQKIIFSLTNCWINKNYKGNYNAPHAHPESNFAGIYYIQVPDQEGGLLFLNNDTSNDLTNTNEFIEDTCFDNYYRILPKVDMLILFPSNLKHMVEPHYEDKARISLAFNISIEHG